MTPKTIPSVSSPSSSPPGSCHGQLAGYSTLPGPSMNSGSPARAPARVYWMPFSFLPELSFLYSVPFSMLFRPQKLVTSSAPIAASTAVRSTLPAFSAAITKSMHAAEPIGSYTPGCTP